MHGKETQAKERGHGGHGELEEDPSDPTGSQMAIVDGDEYVETHTHRLRTHRKPEGTPYADNEQHTYSLRAHHKPEGIPYVLRNNPNPCLRAYHMPEGTPDVLTKHPKPNQQTNVGKRRRNTRRMTLKMMKS